MSQPNTNSMVNKDAEIDLVQLIREVWRAKWLLAGLTVVSILVAGLHGYFWVAPVYEVNALLASQEAANINHIVDSAGFRHQLKNELMQTFSKAQATTAVNGLSCSINDNLIDLHVTTRDSQLSYEVIISALALIENVHNHSVNYQKEIYVEYLADIRVQAERTDNAIELIEKQIDDILSSPSITLNDEAIMSSLTLMLGAHIERKFDLFKEEYTISQEILSFRVVVVNAPFMPEDPLSINIVFNMAIASILSLMLGVFIILFRQLFK